MPPNVIIGTAPALNATAAPLNSKDDDKVFSWEEVYYYVSTNQIKSIHRSKKVQATYDQWMKNTLSKYGSIEKYLLSTKLHFKPLQDTSKPPVIILPNDFPYSVEKGIQHILLWSQIPLSRDYIEYILETNFGSQNYEWVYWVNPPEIQSVKKLPHVHVFMRPKNH